MTILLKNLLNSLNKIDYLAGKIMPVLLIVMVLNLSLPHFTLAQSINAVDIPQTPQLPLMAGKSEILKKYPTGRHLPLNNEEREPWLAAKIWVSAYNSHVGQTDSTPCLTASGLDLCQRNVEDIIATNFLNLPFGTKVRFPELFGNKVFIVHDRMNKRYYQAADIWMKDYPEAVQFGRVWTTVEIY